MNKHMKISGTSIDLSPSFETPLEGYTDIDHPLTDRYRSEVIKESFQYVNESLSTLCVMSSSGMIMDLKGTRRNKNRMVIVRTLTLGSDVVVDLENLNRILGHEGQHVVDYIANTLIREKGNHERTIVMYYTADITNLLREPEGIHLNQIGVTIFHPRFRDTVPDVRNRKPKAIREDGTEEEAWGSTITLMHVPSSKTDTKPVFTTIGNEVIELPCTEAIGLAPGMHLITHGNMRLGSMSGQPGSIVVKPKDYKSRGFYSSHSELAEAIAGKDRTAEFISVMKESFERQTPPPENIHFLDDFKIAGHSVRDIVQSAGETINVFTKFKNEVKSAAQ